VVKAKRRKFPGIYIVLALIAASVALGFYGNKIAVQPSESTATPQIPSTLTPTETVPPETTLVPPTNETSSTAPTETTPTAG